MAQLAVPYARSLTPDDLRGRDLTIDPPDGFDALSGQQVTFLWHRIDNPTATWSESYRAAGYEAALEGAPESPKIRAYLSALAAGIAQSATTDGMTTADQRRVILRQLARDANDQRLPARERAVAAKVWLDAVPEDERIVIALADLPEDEIRQRLVAALETLRDHDAACRPFLSLVVPTLSDGMQFPFEGNSAMLARDPADAPLPIPDDADEPETIPDDERD